MPTPADAGDLGDAGVQALYVEDPRGRGEKLLTVAARRPCAGGAVDAGRGHGVTSLGFVADECARRDQAEFGVRHRCLGH